MFTNLNLITTKGIYHIIGVKLGITPNTIARFIFRIEKQRGYQKIVIVTLITLKGKFSTVIAGQTVVHQIGNPLLIKIVALNPKFVAQQRFWRNDGSN
jgi:hypothetical protein